MSKHTKGQWLLYFPPGDVVRMFLATMSSTGNTLIAEVLKIGDGPLSDDKEALANAKLIGNAPELLARLRDAQREITRLQGGYAGPLQREINDTIAAAEGRLRD